MPTARRYRTKKEKKKKRHHRPCCKDPRPEFHSNWKDETGRCANCGKFYRNPYCCAKCAKEREEKRELDANLYRIEQTKHPSGSSGTNSRSRLSKRKGKSR